MAALLGLIIVIVGSYVTVRGIKTMLKAIGHVFDKMDNKL